MVRTIWAGLQLLDRQLVDREGRMCGMVDDVELTRSPDTGNVYVSSLLSGPGALATRLGRRRLGPWLRRANRLLSHSSPDGDDPVRIPWKRVTDIGDHVSLALDHHEAGTASGERWVRQHVIDHIRGSGRAPE